MFGVVSVQKNQYTDNMCWVSNTYYLPYNSLPSHGKMEGTDEEIVYYQWTAIILISLAVAWYLVALVWRFFISRHMDLETILKYAESTSVLLFSFLSRAHLGFSRGGRIFENFLKNLTTFFLPPSPSSKSAPDFDSTFHLQFLSAN